MVAGAEVLPPWKQGDYVAEGGYASMTGMTGIASMTSMTGVASMTSMTSMTGVSGVASMTSMTGVSSASGGAQVHVEKHWEQQVTASREVSRVTG